MDAGKDLNAPSRHDQRTAHRGLVPASQVAPPTDDGDGSRGCYGLTSPGVSSNGRGDELAGAWQAAVDAQPPCRRDSRRDVDDEAVDMTRADARSLVVYAASRAPQPCLDQLPNEILLQVFGFLDVDDLLAASRVGSCRSAHASQESHPLRSST